MNHRSVFFDRDNNVGQLGRLFVGPALQVYKTLAVEWVCLLFTSLYILQSARASPICGGYRTRGAKAGHAGRIMKHSLVCGVQPDSVSMVCRLSLCINESKVSRRYNQEALCSLNEIQFTPPHPPPLPASPSRTASAPPANLRGEQTQTKAPS